MAGFHRIPIPGGTLEELATLELLLAAYFISTRWGFPRASYRGRLERKEKMPTNARGGPWSFTKAPYWFDRQDFSAESGAMQALEFVYDLLDVDRAGRRMCPVYVTTGQMLALRQEVRRNTARGKFIKNHYGFNKAIVLNQAFTSR